MSNTKTKKCNYCGQINEDNFLIDKCWKCNEILSHTEFDCLHNQFCDQQSKDGKMFCTSKKGCNFKCPV